MVYPMMSEGLLTELSSPRSETFDDRKEYYGLP